jgi:hypothetical protein
MLPLLLCNVRDQLHDIVDILLHPLNFAAQKTDFGAGFGDLSVRSIALR